MTFQDRQSIRWQCFMSTTIWLTLMLLSTVAQQECELNGVSYQLGDSFGDALQIKCGSWQEFPCFCNPDLDQQAYCPYCSFSAGDGTLHCSKNGETLEFQDGSINRNCTCEIPADPLQEPITTCGVEASSSCPGCDMPDQDGNLTCFNDGESTGAFVDGICGSGRDWPGFCEAAEVIGAPFKLRYPYCVFDKTQFGEVLCASDGQSVTFTNTDGVEETCNCSIVNASTPQETCKLKTSDPSTPTLPPVSRPTSSPAFPNANGSSSAYRTTPLWRCLPILISLFAMALW